MQKPALFGASLGTMIEYFDYAIFFLFFTLMLPDIVGSHNELAALMGGYIVLFISQLVRPLGGWFFGYFGDRLGRKQTLIATVIGISISTFMIGFLPGYATLGAWSFYLLLTLKCVQVFCFGGEYNGAGVYVVEHARGVHENFWGAALTAMTLVGALVATVLGAILTLGDMPPWSWRVAFIIAGIFGLWVLWYRRSMEESPEFDRAEEPVIGIKALVSQYWRQMLVAVSIGAAATVPFTTIVIFINPFMTARHLLSPHNMMWMQMMVVVFAIAMLLLGGRLADKFSAKKIMKIGCVIVIVLAYPALLGLQHHELLWIIVGQLVLLVGNELLLGPSNAYMTNLFPVHARYRGVSVGFCSGMALASGITPFVETWLYRWSGDFTWLFLWPVLIALIAFIAIASQK